MSERTGPEVFRREAATSAWLTGGSSHLDSALADGLYRVTTRYLCAGFVVQGGKVTRCAPILRRKMNYWKTIAVRVAA